MTSRHSDFRLEEGNGARVMAKKKNHIYSDKSKGLLVLLLSELLRFHERGGLLLVCEYIPKCD